MTATSVPNLADLPEPVQVDERLAACVATFQRWLHFPDPGVLLVTLATVAANRAAGDPVWLLIVGPPGGGKTETLGPLTGLDDVYSVATLTEAALLSGTPKKQTAKGAKGGLLREIGGFGIIVCKDFGSILSMHRDGRSAVLAALREVYDGAWTRHLGTDGGRKLDWTGKVGLIAGCTPHIDRHHEVMGTMGERFALYRLPEVDGDAQAAAALRHVGKEAVMRKELTAAVAEVLAATDSTLAATEASPADEAMVIRLSTLAVRCRSAVERDGYGNREIELVPEPEAPARLALVLLRLLNALRAIGTDDRTAQALVSKVALDSMPAIRRRVLEVLDGCDDRPTSAVAEDLGYPTNTTRRALEDLTAHGVVKRTKQGQGKADLWAMSTFTQERWPTSPETSGGA